ncbi:hypothetical protein QCA50_006255 [Cerrena zonata]|uniref:Eisosome component PIL1-domain-containing protein n=1 Tax=Cerrena zonata TaxID=2478898 RepID=A0AAW0GML4_9APHY
MFRSATTRIAHSSTIPSIGGNLNKDLRALQELILVEKTVLIALQKLSSDVARSSEALRQWGTGEGDDLGDISTAAGSLLLHFGSALSRYASHEEAIREQMKSIRTREEQLDELKRRRKAVASKADAAERKLSKMNPDNKNMQSQTDILARLRDEMRGLDTEIMNEEATLGDFKRYSVKQWLGLKFGGLQECCQKGAIVGEFGKLVIAEIPFTQTQPGLPRPYYNGHSRTEYLVAEANRMVSEVPFSIEAGHGQMSTTSFMGSGPSPAGSDATSLQQPPYLPPQSPHQLSRPLSMQFTGAAEVVGTSVYPPPMPMSPQDIAMSMNPNQNNNAYGSFSGLPPVPAPTTSSDFGLSPYLNQGPGEANPQMNEFGQYSAPGPYAPRTSSMNNMSNRGNESQPTSPIDAPAGPRAARFATFPVRGGRPPPGSSHSPVMSPLVGPRMDERPPSIDLHRNDSSFSSSIAAALDSQWSSPPAPPTQPLHLHGDIPQADAMHSKAQEANRNRDTTYSPPPPVYTPEPEAGGSSSAAPPAVAPPQGLGKLEEEDQDNVQLAYMSNPEDSDRESSSHPDRADRRVRFGSVRDVDTELAKRAVEHQQHDEQQYSAIPPVTSPPQVTTPPPTQTESQIHASPPPPSASPPVVVTSYRPSSPSADESHMDEEKVLNVAAAREVSRELDALMFTSPLPPHPVPPPIDRTPSPLEPPHPPFARNAAPRMDVNAQAPPPASRRESLLSPLSPRNEPQYIRERDRADRSTPTSPAFSNAAASPPSEAPLPPPPNINLPERSTSSFGTPYRTPSEHPTGSGSIYNMAGMTGSASSFGTGAKISAAAFKRQIRSPGSLGGQSSDPTPEAADVSPLSVKKRTLPGSPYPSQRLTPGDGGVNMQRVPSAPTYGAGAPDQGNGWQQPRSTSAGNEEGGHRRFADSGGPQDEEFDYISAYVNNSPQQGGFDPAGLR